MREKRGQHTEIGHTHRGDTINMVLRQKRGIAPSRAGAEKEGCARAAREGRRQKGQGAAGERARSAHGGAPSRRSPLAARHIFVTVTAIRPSGP